MHKTWKKGDRLNLTTCTAGPQAVVIVAFIRRNNGMQDTVLATPSVAEKIFAGEIDHRTAYICDPGVRRIDTQRLHSLTSRGLAVAVA